MAIVAGQVLSDQKHVVIALRKIYGVGQTRSEQVCKQAGVDPSTKVVKLTEAQLDKIRTALSEYVIEGDLRREVQMRIKLLKDIGTRRGRRHRSRLPVRGQRTKTNAKTAKGRGRRAS